MAHLTLSVSEKRKITEVELSCMRPEQVWLCGDSLQFDTSPAKSKCDWHKSWQLTTGDGEVRTLGLFAHPITTRAVRPFVHVDLCCRDSRILSITVSSSSVTYFDVFCSWLILLIFPLSANFLLLCTIVHLFNTPRHGMDTFDIDSMLAFLLQVDKSPTFRRLSY